MRVDLQSKTALVTGSTSGIGYAIAKALAEAGARVIVHGRSPDHVAEARARLTAEVSGANVTGQAADLADAAATRRLVDAFPRVDILVSNAGPIESAPFFEASDETWLRYQDVYVTAAARLARHYMPKMIEAGWGRLVYSAGMTCGYTPGDRKGASKMIAWVTAKSALLGLARGLAEAAAGTAVTVNAFIPGPAPTPDAFARAGIQLNFEDFARDYFDGPGLSSILGRFIAPSEIANLVVFLASNQASAITGATLRVDGGIIRTLS